MSEHMVISRDDIIHQAKLASQIPSIVEGLISRRIINRVAEAQAVKVEDEELQQAADVFRASCGLLSANDTWTWLQKHGLSLDDFEEIIHMSLIASKLATHLFANKVERFFVDHQVDYTQAVVYEVLLDDEDLAMELFFTIQEGEISFHQVAHQYIQDPELRRVGGYRGLLRRADLKPEVAAAVFSATPPQLLKPILTAKGSTLILVEEILQPELDAALRSKILSDLFADWLKSQLEQVEVTFAPELNESQNLSGIVPAPAAIPN